MRDWKQTAGEWCSVLLLVADDDERIWTLLRSVTSHRQLSDADVLRLFDIRHVQRR